MSTATRCRIHVVADLLNSWLSAKSIVLNLILSPVCSVPGLTWTKPLETGDSMVNKSEQWINGRMNVSMSAAERYCTVVVRMKTSSSAVAKRPRDASCLSVVSFNGTKRRVEFLRASLYVSKRGAYWDRLCRDVVGRWLVVNACTVAKRCILGL